MVVSPFLLVFWPTEKRYSKVSRESIVDGTLRKEDDSVLKAMSSLKLMWNRKVYFGKVVDCGVKQFITDQLLSNAPEEEVPDTQIEETDEPLESRFRKRSKKEKKADEVKNEIIQALVATAGSSRPSASLTEIPSFENLADSSSTVSLQEIEKRNLTLETQLKEAKGDAEKYKNRAKRLKHKLTEMKEQQNNDVDIGFGVLVPKGVMERINVVSPAATIFARNLFRTVFSKDELKDRSLFGRRSNANKDKQVKPGVDELKRNAVIAYALDVFKPDETHSIARQKEARSYILAKIHKTLGEYIREVNNEKLAPTE